MKIAIIVPWIYAISGNITSINLAEELSNRGHEVDFVSYEVYSGVLNEISNRLIKSKFIYMRVSKSNLHTSFQFFIKQYLRRFGKRIIEYIYKTNPQKPYNLILLIADEGLETAKIGKKLLGMDALYAISVMEIPEHNFYHNQRFPEVLSFLIYPIYYLLHRRYKKLLSSYDLIFGNSKWTSVMTNFFYGVRTFGEIQSIDHSYFLDNDVKEANNESYIAIPTASLGYKEMKHIYKLLSEGVRAKIYGPIKIESDSYLGYLPKNEMIEVIQGARAILFLFDYEALGLIPLEALALGVPVITYGKEGPSLSLSDCSMVKFVNTYEEIKSECMKALANPMRQQEKYECKNCVTNLTVSENTSQFLKVVNSYDFSRTQK